MNSPRGPDRILSLCFILGISTLAFIGGSAVFRYHLPPYRTLDTAFAAVDDWRHLWDEALSHEHAVPEPQNNAARDLSIINHGEVSINSPLAYPGYTLVSIGFLPFPFLVDMKGKVVFRWNPPYQELESGCINPVVRERHVIFSFADQAHLFPNGDIIIQYGILGVPYGCGVMKIDKDSHVIWKYKNFVHHDSTLDEAGNIYVIVLEVVAKPIKGLETLHYPMATDNIVKLSPGGKELDRISIIKAFQNTPFELMLYHGKADGDFLSDFMHTNSVDVLSPSLAHAFPMFKAGDILVSIRSMHALAVIDPQTRKVVWAAQGYWHYEHAASFLPNGHMLLLDNEGHTASEQVFSRVIEFDPMTLGVTWYYAGSLRHPFYTNRIGRLQRLPNGNTLIDEGAHARIFEVTPEGTIVWNYTLQQIPRQYDISGLLNGIFITRRYAPDQVPFLKQP